MRADLYITPSRLVSVAPACSADTDAVLQELGYSVEAIAR